MTEGSTQVSPSSPSSSNASRGPSSSPTRQQPQAPQPPNLASPSPPTEVGMVEAVRGYLNSENRTYQELPLRDDGSRVLSMNLSGHHANFRCFIDLKVAQDRMLVFIESPVKVPEPQRAVCAELLMRINYQLALGNFELDFRDGEVRYRMAVDVEGSHLSRSMIETNIMVPAATMDRYFSSVMAVVFGNKSPTEALREFQANAGNNNRGGGSGGSLGGTTAHSQ